MSKNRILVVDDEPAMQRILQLALEDLGHEVVCAGNGVEALVLLESESMDMMITDLRMPEMDGITLLKKLEEKDAGLPTIVITAHGTVETAVEAMKFGACDYILRPFDVDMIELAVSRALGSIRVRQENQYLRSELSSGWQDFIGASRPMKELYRLIEQVGKSNAAAFIVGKTGTGKELVARALHNVSGREGLFVPINCAAIPDTMLESELFGHVKGAFTGAQTGRPGKFEVSDGGTLFLDEITEMPLDLQAKLLRVLQDGRVERLGSHRSVELDLRVVAATNRDPLEAVREKRLREDLYYRLNVFTLNVPELARRGDDIALLASHFIKKHAKSQGMEPPALGDDVLSRLKAYSWPGNVRELENAMERAVVLGGMSGQVDAGCLPGGIVAPGGVEAAAGSELKGEPDSYSLPANTERLEKQLIEQALAKVNGNKSKAARLMEVSERTLWYKIKKYGLM
ncbi:MAG: sigma-54-dependent Fis family transcriptional regulator [Gammaproteobacteria bacterium]|nr:MAG: sigma-54-dependent Fis family transcriptional regulator [Gammaproteobacteria bacterium]